MSDWVEKYREKTKNKIKKPGNWTLDFVKEANKQINDEDIYPICIVSYKRGYKCSTIQNLKDSNVKKYVFVYSDDYDNYKEIVTNPEYKNFEIIFVDVPEKGLQHKREFVNRTMSERGFKRIFQLDDDIEKVTVGYSVKNTSPKNKRDTIVKKMEISLVEGLKTTQYSFNRNLDKNIGLFSFGGEFQMTLRDFELEEEISLNKICCQCVLINLELLNKYNIHYTTEPTWEDYDIVFKCIMNKLNVAVNRFLAYVTPDRNKTESVVFNGKITGNYNKKKTEYNMRMYLLWGNIISIKRENGELDTNPCIKKLYNRVKRGEKIEIEYDPIMLDLCKKWKVEEFHKHTAKLVTDRKESIKNKHFNNINKFINESNITNKEELIVELNKNFPHKYVKLYIEEIGI